MARVPEMEIFETEGALFTIVRLMVNGVPDPNVLEGVIA